MVQLIIPCYNEAERFNKKLFFSFVEALVNVHFIFVNDGSTDTTNNLLEEIRIKALNENPDARVTILNLPKNVGKAAAVREGILFALKNSDTEFVSYFDADFSTPLSEISNFIKVVEIDNRRKAVFGSRIKKAGSHIERSQIRHYTGRIFATVVNNLVLKIAIYDTQCGAKLFTRECAENIFKEPFISRWLFDIELIVRIQVLYQDLDLNKIIYEQPLEVWKEMGNSKIRFKDLLKMPYQLFLIYNKQTNDFKKSGRMV